MEKLTKCVSRVINTNIIRKGDLNMKITLKDGSVKEYSEAKSVYDIAADISEGLARVACAGEVDGEVVDLRTVLDKDCNYKYFLLSFASYFLRIFQGNIFTFITTGRLIKTKSKKCTKIYLQFFRFLKAGLWTFLIKCIIHFQHKKVSHRRPRDPWHPEKSSYRCFLPDLTGFGAFRRTGLGLL